MSVLNPFLASNSKSSDAASLATPGSTGVSVRDRPKVPQMAAPISDSDPSACASRATSRCYSFQLYGSHAGRRSDLTVLSVARVSEWKSDLDVFDDVSHIFMRIIQDHEKSLEIFKIIDFSSKIIINH